jgi:histone deacetylase 6
MTATTDMPLEKLFHIALRLNSIYMNPSSIKCALLSAGSVCEVTEHVIAGNFDNGVAVVRPPGHHAESHKAMGFCFFNNVAIAAKMAIEKHGIQRVLIVDWDVHHGNATQHMFYDDDRVLFVSLHRYDNAGFYPGSEDANYDRVGQGKGEGYNINIAWNGEKMGDAEYISAFNHIVMPVAYEYNPELILISCGFDSGQGDPLGGYNVTPNGYAHMTHLLKALANGKIVIALEGGYNLTTISNSMSAVVQVLLGDTPSILDTSCVPNKSATLCVSDVGRCLSKYWKSLYYWAADSNGSTTAEADDKIDLAPVTEDSMTEQDKPDEVQVKPQTTPPSEDLPPPEAEAPPPDTIPFPSERMPLNQAQQTIIKALEDDGNTCMFAVTPLAWCPHLKVIVPFPPDTVDTSALCETCGTHRENWVCLTCHHVFCGRYINKHMLAHYEATDHHIVLSYADLSVWCFACDSYVHNPVLFPYIKIASEDKFKD